MELEIDIAGASACRFHLRKLEGGSSEGVLLVVPIRGSTVRKEHHDLVNGLRVLGEKILQERLEIELDIQSRAITQNISGSFLLVWGFLLVAWTKSGYLAGSLMKKVGVLRRTQSKFPSSVFNLIAIPWTSRTVSAEPDSPATVENRTVASTWLPTCWKRFCDVMSCRWWATLK